MKISDLLRARPKGEAINRIGPISGRSMARRESPKNKTKNTIRRFDIAVMQTTYFNIELAKYIHSTGDPNPPGPVPPKLSVDRQRALTELNDSAEDVLLLFKKYRLDATPIFVYLMDSHLVRRREFLYDLPTVAALKNLRLHALDEKPSIPHRFQIHVTADSQIAILDGQQYPITIAQATILKKLMGENGGFVAAWKLKTSNTPEARPDRIIKRLPKPIQSLIRTKTGPHGGASLPL